jgi:hypothetical protein
VAAALHTAMRDGYALAEASAPGRTGFRKFRVC